MYVIAIHIHMPFLFKKLDIEVPGTTQVQKYKEILKNSIKFYK